MLLTPANEFEWEVSNFSAKAFTLAAFGSAVTPGTNSKGSWATALLSNTAYDAYGIYVCIGGCGTSGAAYGGLLDIGIDPANGTSYSVLIPNLAYSGASIVLGGNWYYFPLFIPKGSSVSARAQASTGTTAIRVGVKLVGAPTRPELVKAGSFVEVFNANTSTSFGTTAVTEGATGTWGSFTASLGTTAKDLWFWQLGICMNDSALTKYLAHFFDVWGGASSSDTKLIENASWNATDTELLSNMEPQTDNYELLPGGSGIYVRAMSTGAAESNVYPIVYGVGG